MSAAATWSTRGTDPLERGDGRAEASHRTARALRLPRGAPRGPEVHERLVEVVRPPARHEDLGEVPERPLAADAREPPRAEEDAAKNAADVGVQHGGVPSVGERKNPAHGVPADPRQASERG